MFLRWRYKQFHPSYLLGWLSGGLLIGLVLGKSFELNAQNFLLFASFALLISVFKSRRWWAIILISFVGVAFGLVQGNTVIKEYMSYSSLVGRESVIEGKLNSDAQPLSNAQLRFTLTEISVKGQKYPGEIIVSVYGKPLLKRGDTVEVVGKMRPGFGAYGATLYAGKVLSISRDSDIIRDTREHFSRTVRDHVLEPMASLGLGFVVGQRSTLPETLDDQLKLVGLTHIVVASGYNLTILVRFVMRLLSRHSRYLAFVCSLLMIFSFVLFSGFSPSMNRAVIVTVLGLLAWYVGRRFHPVLLIVYVAALTAYFNPMYVWADLGWYLSFFAFAGILIVSPLLLRFIYIRRKPSSFEQLICETISAQITALPVVAFAFGTIPVFSLIANILVAPFIPAAMALIAVAGIAGMISSALGGVIALPSTILISYMIAIVEWLAGSPLASYSFKPEFWMVSLWYTLLTVMCVFLLQKSKYNFRTTDKQLEL